MEWTDIVNKRSINTLEKYISADQKVLGIDFPKTSELVSILNRMHAMTDLSAYKGWYCVPVWQCPLNYGTIKNYTTNQTPTPHPRPIHLGARLAGGGGDVIAVLHVNTYLVT